MKILQICSKPPYPPNDGGCLASLRLSEEITMTGMQLDVIAMATPKHPYNARAFDPKYLESTHFQAQFVNTKMRLGKLFSNLFKSISIWEDRFRGADFASLLKSRLEDARYDVIIIDGLMGAVYIDVLKENTTAPLLYRAHNIEYEIPSQQASLLHSGFRKWYLKIQAGRLKKFEHNTWKKVTGILCISARDSKIMKHYLKDVEKVYILPFGIEAKELKTGPQSGTVFHLGAMDWQPNIDGLRWFCRKVWPIVKNQIPKAELHLGGRNIHAVMQSNEKSGIFIHQTVPDATAFIQSFDVMIVPLKTGSGTRIKILEGLAAGKVIVTTTKGIEGIACNHKAEVLIANDAGQFAEMVIRALSDNQLSTALKQQAMAFIEQNYLPSRNVEKLIHILKILREKVPD